MNENRQISEREKKYVLKRDKYACRYCGTKKGPFEFDHVYPYVKGGETSINNIVTSCGPCNRRKHDYVGMWPKPVGYFDGRNHINLVDVFLAALGLALVGNGFWSINLLEMTWGKGNIFIGIVVLSFMLAKMSLGK